ncbi:MAG: hypothetical protein NWE92_13835 [Candidatus Bathyarchaeota archaeon]|nr:hypothetical protein [Candidatus Bathyarchaeota archaeon]
MLRTYFKDSAFECEDCATVTGGDAPVSVCIKPQPCYHQINNAKIHSATATKKEPAKYFLFYYSITFQNRLRPKNEEAIPILVDTKGNLIDDCEFEEASILRNPEIEVRDSRLKIKPEEFETLKKVADKKLGELLKQKLALFDLPLRKEQRAKLKSFDRRLRRERREQVIARKHEFDYPQWQANYQALLKREEESFITTIAVKFANLLIINTSKVSFELELDNHSSTHATFVLGITQPEVTCPICRKPFHEGYATQDELYVCGNCIRQSVDTAKIYSKKAALTLDDTLNEYVESNGGFVCSVCGKRHSRLLEFKCSHDNSSVCIQHYGLCDICGKIFSKSNLTYTQEFKRQLCPAHTTKCSNCQATIGVDEGKLSKSSGKILCADCFNKTGDA